MTSVLVELKATSTEFMAKMKEARAEITKLGTESSGNFAKLQAVGKAALLGTAAAAGVVGVASIKLAADFQQSMTQLVTGAGESEKNMKMVGAGILDLSTKTGYSAQELAKGMYAIESAGNHGAAGLQVLKAAAEGARAGNAEMATVADALTTALNAYHMPASKAITVTNQLIATEQSGKLTMEQLAGSLGSVVPAAASAHLSLSEVLGAIATMTSQGTDASNATTYLRQTILQLENPTAKARQEMEDLGLSSIDISKNLGQRGLTGTLTILTDAIAKKMGPAGTVLIEQLKKSAKSTTDFQKVLANLPPAQQTVVAALANMVGGTKSMQAALELTGGNMATFKQNVDHISGAAKGAGKDVNDWALVQDNFNLKLENAKNAVEAMGIRLGTVLIPKVEAAAKAVAAATVWFQQHKDVAMALAAAVGGFLVAAITAYIAHLTVAAAKSIGSFAKMIAAGVQWAATQTVKFAEVAASALAAFASMVAEAAVWAAGMAVSAAVAMAPFLPIIALLAAVGAAAYELYTHWNTVWGGIKTIIHDAWTWIKDHVAFIVGAITLIFPELGLLIAAVHAVWTHWQTIWDAIKTATSAVVAALTTVFHALAGPVLAIVSAGVTALRATWGAAWDAIQAVVKSVWGVLSPILHAIVDVGLAVIRRDIDTLKTVWSAAWNGIQTVIQGVWDVIRPIFDAIRSAAEDVANAIGKVTGAAGAIGHAGGGLISGVGHLLGFADGGVVPGVMGTPRLIVAHAGERITNPGQQQTDRQTMAALLAEVAGLRQDVRALPRQHQILARTV